MADPFPMSGKRRRLPDEGQVAVFVADEQAAHPVDEPRWARLAADALGAQGIRGEAELSLLFVDETTMAELNQRFMGHAGPTDVLAFPIDEELVDPGRWPDGGSTGPPFRSDMADPPLLLGDVVICPAVAAANVASGSGSLDDEIALLVVHGILHVLGHDHADPEEEAAMKAKERDLLERFHRQG